ncbi:MAG: hypothetical protein AAF566_09400 [Pseudomonadota bacterium]
MIAVLQVAARHGRVFLLAGLAAGFFLPGLAAALRPWLPEMIACLLALTAYRIGPRAAIGGFADLRRSLALVAIYQLVLPLAALAVLMAFGVAGHPLALAAILMLAAPSVTGAPNFAILLGHDPAPALRLLVLGTAAMPVTVLPVLAFGPGLGSGAETASAALRLLGVIAAAASLGFFIRYKTLREIPVAGQQALDGAASLLLGVVVVGLMSALGPAFSVNPASVLAWLAAAFVLNFGLQFAAAAVFGPRSETPGWAIAAGNRNIALFLVALPADITDPLLVFIGCYQVPMYLTPILLERLYRAHR